MFFLSVLGFLSPALAVIIITQLLANRTHALSHSEDELGQSYM